MFSIGVGYFGTSYRDSGWTGSLGNFNSAGFGVGPPPPPVVRGTNTAAKMTDQVN